MPAPRAQLESDRGQSCPPYTNGHANRPEREAPRVVRNSVYAPSSTAKIRVGVSSCLLGARVRYDGGHKCDAWINGTLAAYFEFVPVCPEVAIGLGTPRQPIRLIRSGDGIRVRGVDRRHVDVTERLRAYGRSMAAQLTDISGYIFKRGSPSCGLRRVPIYDEAGRPVAQGVGAYARAIMDVHPLLPCEEEGRLDDPEIGADFITRVLAYKRWQDLVRQEPHRRGAAERQRGPADDGDRTAR